MAANFADRPPLQRVEWATRTADLDAGTTDLHEENTSDLTGVRTEDFANSPPSGGVTSAMVGSPTTLASNSGRRAAAEQTRSVTHDISRVASERKAPSLPQCGPGSLLSDRFLLEKVIGQGGTATVFCARDLQASDKRSPSARVAIKVPKLDAKDPERAISRLQHEFRHAQSLSHSSIVQVLELGNDQQTWFMTMELIEGNALSTVLRDRQWLSDARKLAILRSCADALSFAHSHQVVHGDFKPANILITADGQAKVFDFGAAAATSGEDTRIPAGTPAYASPQILTGERPDARDDVFSFACVAYEVLTGEHPFKRRSSLEAREQALAPERAWNLSVEQWLALLSGLSWEREQRPASIELLMRDLSATPAVSQTKEASAAPAPAVEIVEEIVPAQRSWGFFSFILIALAIGVLFLLRESTDPLNPQTPGPTLAEQSREESRERLTSSTEATSPTSLMSIVPMAPASAQKLFSGEGPAIDDEAMAEEQMQVTPTKAPARPAIPLSTIAFVQDRIETPEGSIAAVFIVTRSPPLSGRASVNWKISDGSASIDEDFIASASGGTVHFADGQSQRAIYIPLRNDLDAEGDETFTLELATPKRGRVGSVASVEATIRDDD